MAINRVTDGLETMEMPPERGEGRRWLVREERTGNTTAVVYSGPLDAALYTAAPDLLTAAKLAANMMGSPYLNTDGLTQAEKINFTNALNALRKAIEKSATTEVN